MRRKQQSHENPTQDERNLTLKLQTLTKLIVLKLFPESNL
ncbi:unnamed protein product [Brassica oleracea var. botrytis]